MNLSVSAEMSRVNANLDAYLKASKKLPEEAIKKQVGEFGYNLYRELRTLAPGKGTLRAQALGLLASRVGIKVRESVRSKIYAQMGASSNLSSHGLQFERRGRAVRSFKVKRKRMNIQALAVRAEINLRERAAGFLAIAARFPDPQANPGQAYSDSIYAQALGSRVIKASGNAAQGKFTWGNLGPQSLSAATGLSKARAEGAIARALANTSENMLVYIRRKALEYGRSAPSPA
jgi:hypothetical protein